MSQWERTIFGIAIFTLALLVVILATGAGGTCASTPPLTIVPASCEGMHPGQCARLTNGD